RRAPDLLLLSEPATTSGRAGAPSPAPGTRARVYRWILAPVTVPWSDLAPRVVAVARYHERDGIGRYADQLAAAYGEGRTFIRLGFAEGPGDWHRDFHRGLRA